jgi:hypothetical protein
MSPHRIVLLNFTEAECNQVAKAGYNVDRGLLGEQVGLEYCQFECPHPLYEYDVLFYKAVRDRNLTFSEPRNLFKEKGSLRALLNFSTPPKVRVAFIGQNVGTDQLILGGIPFATLVEAEPNVSSLVETEFRGPFAIDKLHQLIAGFKNNVKSIGQFYRIPDQGHPFNHCRVLASKSN